ncbi:signal recognition particle-docking protein FtsY [Candidatus Woesearchaeota archaeon CG10_big_fil_rev_8_21_14_0_10_36_11]|nr:MAG: signal recognition particle-docking protein FtsY [Candidatus Woesearchaeota archaeon CG10_big_fil_rev_8_21_14_0_10_36_11]
MFGKLKDKLKSALNVFSKKAEEEAEVEEAVEKVVETEEIVEKEVPKKAEPKKEKQVKERKEKVEVKKETVLIFHGWEDNAESGFIPSLKSFLNKKNYTALSFNQPNTKSPKFDEWFSFIDTKISALDKDNLSLVGHSMGGLLALKLAEKYQLQKLFLIAPVGSKPSEKYFQSISKELDKQDLQIYKEYQDKSLDIQRIKSNVKEIAFVFGLKDTWITEEIRTFYINSFKDVAEIHIFDSYAHMSPNEGTKELPIVNELFTRKFKHGVVEHKETKQKVIIEEKEIVEEPQKEDQKEKKSFFKKLFSKDENEQVVEKEIKTQKEEESIIEEQQEEKKSIFERVKQSITTKTISADKFDELFWNLEIVLLENNVSVEVIDKIKNDLKKELIDKPLPRDVPKKIEETLKNTLHEILSSKKIDLIAMARGKKPFVITFFGINGTGKTTSIAKLTHYFQQHKLSVVLAACDTFRAAAIQQLEEHAVKLGVKIIKHDYGSDAAAVAFDAAKYAEKNNIDVVMIDTAGRLHSNTNLMAELEKIIRVTKPDLKIFVGESITGNDCIEQAKKFNELVEMDGAILTKADVDEKGGAPLSISYTIKKPILFLGVGQKYEDLEEFDANKILHHLGF